jgi:glutamyl-tRNA reductase
VLTAARSDRPLITSEQLQAVSGDRRWLAVDLGLPRNIAPELSGEFPGLRLVDLDGLKAWYRSRSDFSGLEARARTIIRGEESGYFRLLPSGWSGSEGEEDER